MSELSDIFRLCTGISARFIPGRMLLAAKAANSGKGRQERSA
jgi:hypothetical protein